jgi:hypothetical protein
MFLRKVAKLSFNEIIQVVLLVMMMDFAVLKFLIQPGIILSHDNSKILEQIIV